ncbi:hypothetical protein BHM03_00051230 [Ensete ventricosum]|nr:hypothetical protein BHM03_00051230 [Ensete ventricosum]
MNRLAIIKSSASPATNRTSQPKELTREELRERLTRGLCWYCDKSLSRDHRCKRRRLLLIEPLHDSEEEDHKHKEEVMEEEPHPTDCMMHALAGYVNP